MTVTIAIPEPTGSDAAYNARSLPLYLAALEAAGASPMVVPLNGAQDRVAKMLAGCRESCCREAASMWNRRGTEKRAYRSAAPRMQLARQWTSFCCRKHSICANRYWPSATARNR